MRRRAVRSSWVARGLMLLSALLLFAAPAMSYAAARGDCCAEAPCHDQGKSPRCPDACMVACQVVAAPEIQVTGAVGFGLAAVTPLIPRLPPGREPTPELPPPR